jgi:hypothetical protein
MMDQFMPYVTAWLKAYGENHHLGKSKAIKKAKLDMDSHITAYSKLFGADEATEQVIDTFIEAA